MTAAKARAARAAAHRAVPAAPAAPACASRSARCWRTPPSSSGSSRSPARPAAAERTRTGCSSAMVGCLHHLLVPAASPACGCCVTCLWVLVTDSSDGGCLPCCACRSQRPVDGMPGAAASKNCCANTRCASVAVLPVPQSATAPSTRTALGCGAFRRASGTAPPAPSGVLCALADASGRLPSSSSGAADRGGGQPLLSWNFPPRLMRAAGGRARQQRGAQRPAAAATLGAPVLAPAGVPTLAMSCRISSFRTSRKTTGWHQSPGAARPCRLLPLILLLTPGVELQNNGSLQGRACGLGAACTQRTRQTGGAAAPLQALAAAPPGPARAPACGALRL
jgi:hypothetical protein